LVLVQFQQFQSFFFFVVQFVFLEGWMMSGLNVRPSFGAAAIPARQWGF
jgi:hypothetical protein